MGAVVNLARGVTAGVTSLDVQVLFGLVGLAVKRN